MAPDKNPESRPEEAPLAEVVHINSRRPYRLTYDIDDLSEVLGLMQPPVAEEWEVDGNLYMHDRLMMGRREWSSRYDRERPGTVIPHPSAPPADDHKLADKLFEVRSSLTKFITLKAIRHSEAMSDADITGIDYLEENGPEPPGPSAA